MCTFLGGASCNLQPHLDAAKFQTSLQGGYNMNLNEVNITKVYEN